MMDYFCLFPSLLQCDTLEIELQSEKENHEKAIVQLEERCTILKSQQQEEQSTDKTDQLVTKMNSIEVIKNNESR